MSERIIRVNSRRVTEYLKEKSQVAKEKEKIMKTSKRESIAQKNSFLSAALELAEYTVEHLTARVLVKKVLSKWI